MTDKRMLGTLHSRQVYDPPPQEDTVPPDYRHLLALVMQSPAAMCLLLGPEYTVALANPACCTLVGKPATQLLDKPIRTVFSELNVQPLFSR